MKVRLAALAVVLAACGGEGVVETLSVDGADDTVSLDSALSSDVPVGSVLEATTGVNLRTGPSTSSKVLLVVPTGGRVKTVGLTSPSAGFYKVEYGGTVGYSHGNYYRLVTSGGAPSTPVSSNARAEAIERAKSMVGFSYWWGHGRFLPQGPTSANRGACSGSCPSCSHSGTYGGDCSGLAGKVWQVGRNGYDMSIDGHPYSTYNFTYERAAWHSVSRAAIAKADAMVYNQNGAGHIFIFESGDGWGSMWAYECRNCDEGCVHNLRTAGSEYQGIGRNGY